MIKEFKISHSITDRTPTLTRYMQDITRYPLLTMDEEVELTTLAKAGDERSKQQLIQSNLRFVISIAKQYIHQGVPLEDLIMEGNIGLMNAINKFDPTRGFKLSTYAVWWIRQAILQSLADKGRVVRMPLNQVGLLTRVKKAIQTFYQQHEHFPLPEELAEQTGLPVEKVEEAMHLSTTEISIDTPIGEDNDTSIADMLVSSTPLTDSEADLESLRTDIQRWLRVLKDQRAQDIVVCSFGLNGVQQMSLDELACKHHITRERVRQIQQHSIGVMKKHIPCSFF